MCHDHHQCMHCWMQTTSSEIANITANDMMKRLKDNYKREDNKNYESIWPDIASINFVCVCGHIEVCYSHCNPKFILTPLRPIVCQWNADVMRKKKKGKKLPNGSNRTFVSTIMITMIGNAFALIYTMPNIYKHTLQAHSSSMMFRNCFIHCICHVQHEILWVLPSTQSIWCLQSIRCRTITKQNKT